LYTKYANGSCRSKPWYFTWAPQKFRSEFVAFGRVVSMSSELRIVVPARPSTCQSPNSPRNRMWSSGCEKA
jgi:hypothetical protein